MTDNQNLTTAELAKRWDVEQATLRSWRSQKKGPPYFRPSGQSRGSVRYRLADVEEWEARNSVGNGSV